MFWTLYVTYFFRCGHADPPKQRELLRFSSEEEAKAEAARLMDIPGVERVWLLRASSYLEKSVPGLTWSHFIG